MSWTTILTVLLVHIATRECHGWTGHFGIPPHHKGIASTTGTFMSKSSVSETKKPTLTDETTWRIRLLLNGVTTKQGRKIEGQLFVLEGKFVEEEGYEPPQGAFQMLKLMNDGLDLDQDENANGTKMSIKKSRWILSEDPNDRKDGLWIWGLFKEPLYPFMLLQIETEELKLLGAKLDEGLSSEGESDSNIGDSIPPLKLYAQISHIRSDEVGVELKPANLNVRILETLQLPGASVDLYEEEQIGQISFQPL